MNSILSLLIYVAALLGAAAVLSWMNRHRRAAALLPGYQGPAVAAVALAFLGCFRIVAAGHAGVGVVFGSVQPTALVEGLNLVNPFVTAHDMTTRTETYTMSSVANEGAVRGDDAIQALSSDGLQMPLDVTIAYRLVASDAPWVYQNIGPNYIDKIVRPASRTAVRDAVADYTAQEAYSSRRAELETNMYERLTQRLQALLAERPSSAGRTGFVVEQVMLRNIQLPPKIREAIEQKLFAEQEALRMQFVLQREEQEAERKRIEAQGVADFQRIVTSGISEPLLIWKGIEATEKLAASSNSKVVVIGAGKSGLPLILGAQ
ncbi:MAG: prohibitin family protein [Candidatus Latescibacterota bacterium]